MPELRTRPVGVVVCAADPDALDRLVPPGHGARLLRVAPDESLVVVEPAVVDDVRRELQDRIAAIDADALVLDVSDGWASLALVGHDADDAFSNLSGLEAPTGDGFVQGDVARVGARVLREPDGLLLLVPAYWREHIRVRAIADAGATEVIA